VNLKEVVSGLVIVFVFAGFAAIAVNQAWELIIKLFG